MRLAAAVVVALAFGCDSAPDNPTWTADIKPIIHANCARCHGPVLRGGAPSTLFLYDQVAGFASRAAEYVEDEDMPPTTPLSDVQKETIANWAADPDLPLGDPVGSRPTFELIEPVAADSNGVITFEYLLSDPDFDVAIGFVFATIDGADEEVLAERLMSGRLVYRAETGAAPGAVIVLRATVTDGDQRVSGVQIDGGVPVDLGGITVPSAATGGSL